MLNLNLGPDIVNRIGEFGLDDRNLSRLSYNTALVRFLQNSRTWARDSSKEVLELGNTGSGDQLNWTTALCRREAEAEYIVGSSDINSYELPELEK